MTHGKVFITPDLAAVYEWRLLSEFDAVCAAAEAGQPVPGVSDAGRRRINRVMLRRANAKFVAAVNAGEITADTTPEQAVAMLPATVLWCIGRQLLAWFLERSFQRVFSRSIVITTPQPPRPAA